MDRHTQCAECRSWASGWLRGSFRISSITCGAPSGGQWAWESSAPQRKPRYRALDRALVRRGLTWTTTVYEKRVVFRRSGPHSSEICVAGCVATELEWLHVSFTSKVVVQRRTGPVGGVNMQSHGKGDMPIQCRKQLSLWLCGVYAIYGPESYSLRASSNLVLCDDCAQDVRMATLPTKSTCMKSHAGWPLDSLNVTCLTLSFCTRKKCSLPFHVSSRSRRKDRSRPPS